VAFRKKLIGRSLVEYQHRIDVREGDIPTPRKGVRMWRTTG